MPEFRWINTVLNNVKTSFSVTFHALRFDKYDDRYRGAFIYHLNRRFDLIAIAERVPHAVSHCTPKPEYPLMSWLVALLSKLLIQIFQKA